MKLSFSVSLLAVGLRECALVMFGLSYPLYLFYRTVSSVFFFKGVTIYVWLLFQPIRPTS